MELRPTSVPPTSATRNVAGTRRLGGEDVALRVEGLEVGRPRHPGLCPGAELEPVGRHRLVRRARPTRRWAAGRSRRPVTGEPAAAVGPSGCDMPAT